MSLSVIHTRAVLGINALPVTVETHLSNGLPSLSIVGLPELAVRESKERVRSALINSGFEFPSRRITINLAPADLPKQGGRYDLAIAIGILVASGQIEAEGLDSMEFIGELALTGELRPVGGILPSTLACKQLDRQLFIAQENALEASLVEYDAIFSCEHLLNICQHLRKLNTLTPLARQTSLPKSAKQKDLSDVQGQFQAKRAMEISAAGRHNILFFGPPGTGKSMLASRLPSILPMLSREHALEVASVYSISNAARPLEQMFIPPFRAPHHTASAVSLVGGGGTPKPGEISLAHHGVLFLDELPEYQRSVLEVLREPIESGEINISRANSTISYPCNFMLIAAMNPCPCGYEGHPTIACNDTPQQISNYRRKLSGPLIDRFDMHIQVNAQSSNLLFDKSKSSESSQSVLQRVTSARDKQLYRQGCLNSELEGGELLVHCKLTNSVQSFVENAMTRLALSARAIHRVLRVARSIADLAGEENIDLNHLSEALSYRHLDRKRDS